MACRTERWNTALDSVHGFLGFLLGPSLPRPRLAQHLAAVSSGVKDREMDARVAGLLGAVRTWRMGVVDEWVGEGHVHSAMANLGAQVAARTMFQQ